MDQDWAGFPKHLLDTVVEKLGHSLTDYLQFGTVCYSWHSIITQSEIIKSLSHHQTPTLMIPIEDDDQKSQWRMYDVMQNRFLNQSKPISIPYNRRFCGSSLGWICAVNKDLTVTLYKPYSDRDLSVCLPCLLPLDEPTTSYYNVLDDSHVRDDIISYDIPEPLRLEDHLFDGYTYDYHVSKVVITADPIENPHDCIILVLFDDMDDMAFYRLFDHSLRWTKLNLLFNEIPFLVADVVHCTNKKLFYAVNTQSAVISFDATSSYYETINLIVPKNPLPIDCDKYIKRYLVESSRGDLFQVEREINILPGIVTKAFNVFQWDFDAKDWLRVICLGDFTFFLGTNSSICVSASDFVGCRPGCIYFTQDIEGCLIDGTQPIDDVGLYNLRTKTFEFHFNIEDSIASLNTSIRPPIWIVPTFNS